MSKPDYHAAAAEVERLIAEGLSQDNARKAVKAARPALHGASLRRAHNALKARVRAADTSSPARHTDAPPLTLVSRPTDAWGDVLARLRGKRFVTVAHISDTHAPYEDTDALALACKVLDYLQPDVIATLSDGCDFPTISPFTPDADIPNDDILVSVQPHWDAIVDGLASAAPNAALRAILGNHDFRLVRWLMEAAPQVRETVKRAFISMVESRGRVHVPDLLGEFTFDCLTVMHGDKSTLGQFGAKRQLEARKYQEFMLSGHAHSPGYYHTRGTRSAATSAVGGCLCRAAHYDKLSKFNHWTQGFAYAVVDTEAHYAWLHQVVFERANGVLMTTAGNKVFSQRVQHGAEDAREFLKLSA